MRNENLYPRNEERKYCLSQINEDFPDVNLLTSLDMTLYDMVNKKYYVYIYHLIHTVSKLPAGY